MHDVPSALRARAEKLRREIEHHRFLYHVKNEQVISDAARDSLMHELSQLEREYPALVAPDSPTQRVSGEPLPELAKIIHEHRMLSFEDAFSFEELIAWDDRWRKRAPDARTDYIADLKLDGLAVSLVFEKGLLVRGATRGDGVVGEDVTHNVRTIDAVPLRLVTEELTPEVRRRVMNGAVEIRGEVVMPKSAFEALNRRQKKAGLPVFANPRNIAAGSMRQLDPKLAAARKLDFYAWELVTELGQETIEESYALIRKLGVKVNPRAAVCAALDEVQAFRERMCNEREKMDFWIDGVVVKVNRRALYGRLGIAGKAPRAAVAYKFPAEQVTTVVENIVIQVGRTGALTPVAHLKPVSVAGTTVSRATLHNADEIKRLDVRIGDTVVVQKAGDIIPDVVQVIKNLRPARTHAFAMPGRCPVCGGPVKRKDGGVIRFCTNVHCPTRQREGLYHFASKKAFDIDGLGPQTIDVLMDEGLVREATDFFMLKEEQLVGLPLFAETKAANLIASIRAARRVTLNRFIYALGIRHVGEQTAIDIAHHFRSIDALMGADEDAVMSVPNIGSVVARSIARFFSSAQRRSFISEFKNVLNILPPPKATSAVFAGATVVVTGTLNIMSREQAHEKIRAAGGTVGTSVGKKTAYLVVGEHPGSKLAQAEKLGVRVLSEGEFVRMLQ